MRENSVATLWCLGNSDRGLNGKSSGESVTFLRKLEELFLKFIKALTQFVKVNE